jgi:hypothetical protein
MINAAVLIFCLLFVPAAQAQAVNDDAQQPNAGAIKRELTPAQVEAIKAIQQKLFEVDLLPIETWLDGFSRDENPDGEIAIWQRIAQAYTEFLRGKHVSLEYKKEVLKVLVASSMMPREDVPQNVSLKLLTGQDVIGIMDLFYP